MPEDNGELINADILEDPFPDLLEALQSQDNASELLLLHSLEEEVVCRTQIQQTMGGVVVLE
jgi:hypothetical protein